MPPRSHRRAAALLLVWAASLLLGSGCGPQAAGVESRSKAGGPPASDAFPPLSATLAFDSERAWADLERVVAFGPRPAGSPSLERLRRWLSGELQAIGLQPRVESFQASTPIGELALANLWAELPGESEVTILLATHIDTKRLPGFEFVGANDGGSSTATVLELARALSAEPTRPVTYRFVFFDGEESIRPDWGDDDSLYGSRHHVAELQRTGELARIGAMVLLDMCGDRDLAFEKDSNSDRELVALFMSTAHRMGRDDLFARYWREILDDHLPFRDAGVPALDLIDLNYGPANSYWHGPDDVLENCSAESLADTGQLVLSALPTLEKWVLER